MSNPILMQHICTMAARLQLSMGRLDALDAELKTVSEALKSRNTDALTAADLVAFKEEARRDAIRERAMTDASFDHKIEQQINRLAADKDQSAAIARIEGRLAALDATTASLDSRVAEIGTRDTAPKPVVTRSKVAPPTPALDPSEPGSDTNV